MCKNEKWAIHEYIIKIFFSVIGFRSLQRSSLQLRQLPLVPRMESDQNNELNYFLF